MSLQRTQSQHSEQSIDSSIDFSVFSSTLSTQSLNRSDVKLPLSNQQIQCPIKWDSPIQKPRFMEQKRESELFVGFQQPFIGFVGMGKGKSIHINDSKMKEALKFMDSQYSESKSLSNSQPSDEKQNDEGSESTESIHIDQKQFEQFNDFGKIQGQFPEFSMGFKNLGSGNAVKISQEASNRAKLFFSQFDQQPKQTKQKIGKQNHSQNNQTINFLKTEKSKPMVLKEFKNIVKPLKKPAIDENKKLLDQMIVKFGQKYQTIRLSDMQQIRIEKALTFAKYWESFVFNDVCHTKSSCQVKWCYFCQKYKNDEITINQEFLKKQILSLMTFQQTTTNRLSFSLRIAIFLLVRTSFIDPTIQNKLPNANNILLATYRKCLAYQKQKVGPLQCSLSSLMNSRGKNMGKQINLIVLGIEKSSQTDLFFIELSDGWTNIYAVIGPTNALYEYVYQKIVIGIKIQIVNWILHPVCNIIEYHPSQEVSQSGPMCIQFSYNNSMLSPYFSKLGWPRELFYRSVKRSKDNAGMIPLVEGIVVRMFSMKNKNTLINYVEVLLKEGECMTMKIVLPEQVTLIELFRLYYCYHFLRVKKVSSTMLQFIGNSKFYQIDDKNRMDKIQNLLKNRMINKESQIKQDFKTAKTYIDLVTSKEEFSIGSTKLIIKQKIEGTVLLQQYEVLFEDDKIILNRGDKGSCLRRIPKIYENIGYHIF